MMMTKKIDINNAVDSKKNVPKNEGKERSISSEKF